MEISGIIAAILVSFGAAFLFARFLLWFDRYEKEPFWLVLGVFLWGALIAGGGAFLINTIFGLGVYLFTGSEAATGLASSILFAPFVEEILKGLAVLLVFFLARNHFDSILDGVVYAGVAALGFAATENAYYIYTYGFLEKGWSGFWDLALIRIGLVGWQHPFYTAFFGIGLATARVNRSAFVKGIAPVIGLFCSMAAHALHNFLASFFSGPGGMVFTTAVDWIGWLLMLVFIVIISRVERNELAVYLKDEVQLGTLTPTQYQVAISAVKISQAKTQALFKGRYRLTNLLYRTTGRLAIKKKLLQRLGNEKDNAAQVESLRRQILILREALA
ncbi:MAG: PrsW family intramembrane metalloprotease [Anaerolineaceae bacterium]|nr:PrsW family intramembrane metalloprotease [Anaerolineaceae bacterium]